MTHVFNIWYYMRHDILVHDAKYRGATARTMTLSGKKLVWELVTELTESACIYWSNFCSSSMVLNGSLHLCTTSSQSHSWPSTASPRALPMRWRRDNWSHNSIGMPHAGTKTADQERQTGWLWVAGSWTRPPKLLAFDDIFPYLHAFVSPQPSFQLFHPFWIPKERRPMGSRFCCGSSSPSYCLYCWANTPCRP